jgi:hydrogenase expression/formation protein HypD
MKHVQEYRDPQLVAGLARELAAAVTRPMRIMEVCGTHTMSIFRHGLRSLFPDHLELISGPGCPVCVTSAGHIDAFIDLAGRDGVIIATFGDLIRVPGSHSSLDRARAAGGRVEVVYSPMDALVLAENNPEQTVIFLGVGFETTCPGIAATIAEAARRDLRNFCVFSAGKIMPPPLRALMQDPELKIDGLLCPGHVSIITGTQSYRFLAEEFGLSCVVSGFEPADVLRALVMLARRIGQGRAEVENGYSRVVSEQGNPQARAMLERVFELVDTPWRGLGVIAGSGFAIREEFAQWDAERRFGITIEDIAEPPGCRCGEILKGICLPPDCPVYGKRCTPLNPIGPCMVSSEGTCAAYYRYSV